MNTTPAAKPSTCELSIDRPGEDALVLQFAGNWRIGEDLPPVDKVLKQIDSNSGVKRISFDTRGLTGWDSGLLTFLIKVVDHAHAILCFVAFIQLFQPGAGEIITDIGTMPGFAVRDFLAVSDFTCSAVF